MRTPPTGKSPTPSEGMVSSRKLMNSVFSVMPRFHSSCSLKTTRCMNTLALASRPYPTLSISCCGKSLLFYLFIFFIPFGCHHLCKIGQKRSLISIRRLWGILICGILTMRLTNHFLISLSFVLLSDFVRFFLGIRKCLKT